MKNLKELGKKKLMTIGAIAVIAVGGVSGVGYKVYADRQYDLKIESALKQEKEKKSTLSTIDEQVLALYQEELRDFLANDVSSEDVSVIHGELDKLQKPSYDATSSKLTASIKEVEASREEIESDLLELQEKVDLQDAVNALFQKEKALNGKTVKEKLVIVDDLTESKLPTIDGINKDDAWSKAITLITSNASNQLKQITTATKLVDGLFDKKVVSKKVTAKETDKASAEVKKIKNDKARKALEARVKTVNDELKKRDKAAAEKKAKEVGGKVVETSDGKVVIEDQSGNTLTQEGGSNNWESDNQSQQWTANNQSNGSAGQSSTNQGSGFSNQGWSNNQGSTGNNWTPPATNNGGGSNNGGSNNSNSGSTGGGSTNNGNSNGGNNSGNTGGGTPTPPPVTEVTLVSGTVGNGGIFGSYEAAVDWARAKSKDNDMNGTGSSSYSVSTLYYSDGSEKYSPNFVAG